MSNVLTQLREACATIAQDARYVRVNADRIPDYAASLPLTDTDPAAAPTDTDPAGAPTDTDPAGAPTDTDPSPSPETAAAFWLTLDAINFGSGWFPTLDKSPSHSGYHTIAAGLEDRFAAQGAWSADQLARITSDEIASTLHQDSGHELMYLFARSLNDLGRHVARDHDGHFEGPVVQAKNSAERLVEHLAGWNCFEDTSTYRGLTVPFLKRAQIAAADLARAKIAEFDDLARLTMFADNLVPHVLRLDGILAFQSALIDRIDHEELIEHGSPEEVEIRACAVHAVELIVAESPDATAADTDQVLWLRGQQPRYKAVPRHRSRSTAY